MALPAVSKACFECINSIRKLKGGRRGFACRTYGMENAKGKNTRRKFAPLLIAAIFLAIAAYIFLQWKPLEESRAIQKSELTKKEKTMANENKDILLPAQSDKTVNILLLGIDDRGMEFKGRTDSIMVVTLDFKNKTTRLTSIMRDSYVEIPGKGYAKINAAYTYGGPELLKRTLKYNFNIDIEHYAVIDFYGFQKVVDMLGGVIVDVKPYEVDELNNYIRQGPQNYLSGSGIHNLNGDQTLAYTSIRFVGNGDYERTERQRRVISLIIDKLKDLGLNDGAKMAKQIYPYLRSDVSIGDMLAYGYSYTRVEGMKIESLRLPANGDYATGKINKQWVMVPRLKETAAKFHQFAYPGVDASQVAVPDNSSAFKKLGAN